MEAERCRALALRLAQRSSPRLLATRSLARQPPCFLTRPATALAVTAPAFCSRVGSRRAAASGAGGGSSEDKASGGAGSEGAKEQQQQQGSEERHAETGEYDTQENYKRVGNPISWANPTGGGTAEDTSSKHWRWVYPAGVATILLLCLWSRRKALKKEQEEELMAKSSISVPDTSSFRTPAYQPPPPELMPRWAQDGDTSRSSEGGDSGFGGGFGGGAFSPPPESKPSSGW
eukprot:TRINITY_DN2341_c0_g1_i1.p1 TRINITY_DN2341_c0_g1~~TRINITY_DN2341_c0_g1_i1.p1  ORF type:complete len:257 (-),score=62.86 TRINITY_DN2341_c0_g1_i1:117-812(-)